MKNFKLLFLALSLVFIACGDDDEEVISQQIDVPEDIIPNITIDIDAIVALPANADITNLVNFGQPAGQSSADYLMPFSNNDTFTLGVPTGLLSGDTLRYTDITFFDENNVVVDFEGGVDQYLELVVPPGEATDYYDADELPLVIFKNFNGETTDIDFKYDLECIITRGGIDYGPYIIDPKFKIKSRL